MALADALAAERTLLPGPVCGVRKLRDQLDDADLAAFDDALGDVNMTAAQLSRALTRIGHRVADQTISRHRQGKCSCGAR